MRRFFIIVIFLSKSLLFPQEANDYIVFTSYPFKGGIENNIIFIDFYKNGLIKTLWEYSLNISGNHLPHSS